ncbi:MAG: autorepressor SdpR family transcription factor [Pseudomonadota bacterium]
MNAVFEALAHPVRRKILSLLKTGPKSAGELAANFTLTKPTMSVHFAKLKQARLVSTERQGTSVVYALNMSVLEEALAGLLSLKDDDQ